MAIAFNDNLNLSAPKPVDKRYLNNSNLPYISIAEVNSSILSSERYIGLTVNINNIEYWYESSVSDGGLVIKTSTSTIDVFVSGGTLTGTSLVLYRTEGMSNVIVELSGLTSGITTNDGVVSGASLNTGTLELHRTEGLADVTVDLSSLNDGVVSGATLNVTTLELHRTEGLADITVDLSSLVSSGNDLYTGSTPSTVTVGGLNSGSVLTGRSYSDIFQEMLVVYQNPAFASSPSVSPQDYTVEVGTTLTGSRTFTWSTTNSGNVSANTISIYDTTDSSYLAQNLADDGSESATITTLQLNSNGATQQWKTEGINTNLVLFSSGNRTVTARYIRYYGANLTSPTDSATVKALPANAFQTSNSNTFQLNTGLVLTKFVVALPPSRTITSVIDLDALNADITSQYVSTGTINVLDAGGTLRTYNLYEMNVGSPYSGNHKHEITTA